MFNLFKKEKPQLKEVSVLDNPKNYPLEVLQIHKEFDTAADRLLEEANSIIEKANQKNLKKVNRLEKLGFNQVKEVEELKPLIKKAELSKEQVELLKHYSFAYPNNKFITEEQVKEICFKYNLVCGEVGRFKGFVPEKNLQEIERFRLRKENAGLHLSNGLFLKNAEVRKINNYWHIFKIGETNIFEYAFQSNEGKRFYAGDRKDIFGLNHLGDISFTVKESNLLICAPIKDMDMKDMTIEGGYKMKEVVKHIPDPVVLHPVNGGFLILTAWGDEASDELMVNQKMN
jgi:hypothetical protein